MLRAGAGAARRPLALAANLWVAGWWLVALVALAALCSRSDSRAPPCSSAYLLVLGLDPEAVALSPFGPSQAGRFYGVSNLLETMLLVPAFLGPGLLGRPGSRSRAIALVAVAGSRFGADGGGLLVLLGGIRDAAGPGAGRAPTAPRRIALAAIVVAGVALVGIDAAFGGSSHVTAGGRGRAGRRAGRLADRLELSCRTVSTAIGPAVRCPRLARRARVVATRRPRRPVTDALLVALLVSLVVNDTPGDVVGFGAVAAVVDPPVRGRIGSRRADAPG